MTHKLKCSRSLIHVCLLSAVALALAIPASAEWKEKVLYSFQGGADGAGPAGGVVFGPDGSLYGATQFGGADDCSPMADCGTVFQVTPQKDGSWTETVLYVFKGKASNDGEYPEGGLIADSAGNLYGTTAYGGTGNCVLLGITGGCGTVYELSPPQQKGGAWTETILYSFPTAKQGYVPDGNLVFDSAGNLYGATTYGGGKGTTCDEFYGGQCGMAFELSPPKTKGGNWTEKVLHNFAGGTDGANPYGGLALDSEGAVYGTTEFGGNEGGECSSGGCGTAFELKPPSETGGAWTEKVLHRFADGDDGAQPGAGVIIDANGSLYGGAEGGAKGGGVLFRLSSESGGRWKESVLYGFTAGFEGGYDPTVARLDKSGNLYGTTNDGPHESLAGSVFRLTPSVSKGGPWAMSLLHGFTNRPDGALPNPLLIFDKFDNLYGSTQIGGTGQSCQSGCGTVYEVSP